MDDHPGPNDRRLYEYPVVHSFNRNHCGKQYSAAHHLDSHQRSTCMVAKRSLSELLQQTKAHWEDRKRRRTEIVELEAPPQGPDVGIAARAPSTKASGSRWAVATEETRQASTPQTNVEAGGMPADEVTQDTSSDDIDRPVARRKGQRPKRPPARYTVEQEQARTADVTSVIPPLTLLESLKERYRLYNEAISTTTNQQAIDSGRSAVPGPPNGEQPSKDQTYGPFANKSGFLLADWYWNSTNKSFSDFQKLISIFRNPDFCVTDSISLNWKSAFKSLGANRDDLRDEDATWIEDDGWNVTSISIDIPFHSQTKDPGTKPYVVGNFRHRSLMSVIKEKLSRVDNRMFHYRPHQETWKPTPSSPEIQLYGEMYASRAFREAYEDLQRQPSTPKNRGLERVVVALMLWSDSTQLTSFGGASLWPCYLFFGNESKYRRVQPSAALGHQVAYFMKLPDHLNDHLKDRNGGKLPTDALFAYCARELFHKQWSVLLNSEFSVAVKEGFIFECSDGIKRCFYPRILTYSADYPEKMLVAGLRNNGTHPCHRCLVEKKDIFKLGSPSDTARDEAKRLPAQQKETILHARSEIEKGYAVNSSTFEESLKALSLVPIESAFDTCLSLDIAAVLVVDALHEVEIGAWKRLLIHLLRLLHFFSTREGRTLSAELDSRYRATPAFGRDTIRKFPLNVSQLRRKAARDFEDLLQCAIPAFECLLPEPHNFVLMTLLYLLAQWHALAKLRLHNDLTVRLLEYTTARLGAQMRQFDKTTCSPIPTAELEKEAEARARRDLKKGQGKGSAAKRPAQLGMYTIKYHFLGDYAPTIRRFGTTDSFSTQIGELYHRLPKSWYARTDRKEYESQLSQTERRHARLSQIRANVGKREPAGADILEDIPSPRSGYTIGMNQNTPLRLDTFGERVTDLKRHLLPRILQRMGYRHQPAVAGRNAWQHVVLHENRIYSHNTLRTTYTTYDTRQDEDVVHIGTPQCNVMLLNRDFKAQSSAFQSPYLYAKIEGIFHANVSVAVQLRGFNHYRLEWHRLDFVSVRWLRFLKSQGEFALDRVEHASGPDACSFLDPVDILRGVHLIPQFALGAAGADDPAILSSDRDSPPCEGQIWKAYYINKFVDRDMFMRYQYGMSVGHSYMYQSAFPPAHVPSIPIGFDWCLDIQGTVSEAGEEDEEAELHGGGRYEGNEALEDMDDRELAVYEEMYDYYG